MTAGRRRKTLATPRRSTPPLHSVLPREREDRGGCYNYVRNSHASFTTGVPTDTFCAFYAPVRGPARRRESSIIYKTFTLASRIDKPLRYIIPAQEAIMKAHNSKLEQGRSLNQRLNRRLISYATAATAAGAGMLGLAQPAEAQIVFTPAHVMIGAHGGYPLDLTNSGTTDFVLHGSVTANSSTLFNALLAKPVLENAVEGATYLGLAVAKALNPGERIGSSQRFVNKGGFGGILMGEAIYSPGGG